VTKKLVIKLTNGDFMKTCLNLSLAVILFSNVSYAGMHMHCAKNLDQNLIAHATVSINDPVSSVLITTDSAVPNNDDEGLIGQSDFMQVIETNENYELSKSKANGNFGAANASPDFTSTSVTKNENGTYDVTVTGQALATESNVNSGTMEFSNCLGR